MSRQKKHKLLVPGPVSVKREVLDKLAEDILFHRSEEFINLYKSVKDLAKKAFQADSQHDMVLLTTSGTMAIEASILSFLSKEDKILVINNGHFACRIEKILGVNGYNFETFNGEWDQPLDYAELDMVVKRIKPDFILCVALETSTGALNSTRKIGEISKKNNAYFFVDAVSAFFADKIDVQTDNIDICITVSNKALEAPSGMSFIYFKKNLLKKKNNIPISLDIYRIYLLGQENQTPFTPNIPIFKAVEMALKNFIDETGGGRTERYKMLSEKAREAVDELGATYYLRDSEIFSSAITSISMNKNMAEKIAKELKRAGYIVWYKNYPEQPQKDVTIFQISVMGDISSKEMTKFINKFKKAYEED